MYTALSGLFHFTSYCHEETTDIIYPIKKANSFESALIFVCPRRDLNPHEHCCPQDFKSCVSTNFTTRAAICTCYKNRLKQKIPNG